MIPRWCVYFLVVVVSLAEAACQLRRPATIQSRMIEPRVLGPVKQSTSAAGAVSVRLLDTLARGHIGRQLLHQQPNGELTEDPVWRWSSAPDRYLDTALRLELAANPEVRLVDSGAAVTLAATLLVWDLESAGETRLVGVVEFQFIGSDRVVHTHMVQASEPISTELPGNLATAAGSLMRRLASEGVNRVAHEKMQWGGSSDEVNSWQMLNVAMSRTSSTPAGRARVPSWSR